MDPEAEAAFYEKNAIITPVKESTRSDVMHVVLDSSLRSNKDAPTSAFRMAFEDPVRSISSVTLRSYYVPRPWYLNASNNTLGYALGDVYYYAPDNQLQVVEDGGQRRAASLGSVKELQGLAQLEKSLSDAAPELVASFDAGARLRLSTALADRSVIAYPGACARLLGFDGAAPMFTSARTAQLESDRPIILFNDLVLQEKGGAARFFPGQVVRLNFTAAMVDRASGAVVGTDRPLGKTAAVGAVDAFQNRVTFAALAQADTRLNPGVQHKVVWGITVCGGELLAPRTPQTEAPASAFLELSNCSMAIGPSSRFTAFAKLWLGAPMLLEEQTVTKRFSPKLPALHYFDVSVKDGQGNVLDLGSDDCHFELTVVSTRFQ